MTFRLLKIRFAVLAVPIAAGLGGCVGEHPASGVCPGPDEGSVVITVNIPGQQTPSTRSIADADGEAAVKSIDVFVFKSDGTREIKTDYAPGKIAAQSSESNDYYRVRFTARLKSEPSATTVAIIANAPPEKVAAASALSDKEDILKTLVHSTTNGGGGAQGWIWNAKNPSDYTPIPMYGEYDLTLGGTAEGGIGGGMKIDGIDLVRMLARVDVTNSAPGFTLSGVYVANYNTAGYIAPAWDPGGGLKQILSAVPMIPGEANPRKGASAAMYYEGSGFAGDIYIYEAEANKGGDFHDEAVCLIVKGRCTGDEGDTYYRIDFTNGADEAGNTSGMTEFDPTTIKYIPVRRNHRYLFEIKSVAGAGYGGLSEALSAPGMMNNLKCSLLVVDERGLVKMIFNGDHYLGVGDSGILDRAGSSVGLLVSTNYTAGWVIEKTTYPGTEKNWLTASKESSGNVRTANLRLTAGPNVSGAERRAVVVLSAGRLKYELEVIQEL